MGYIHSVDDIVVCLGGCNDDVDKDADGFDGIHGWYGVGKKKLEGRMLLVFFL